MNEIKGKIKEFDIEVKESTEGIILDIFKGEDLVQTRCFFWDDLDEAD